MLKLEEEFTGSVITSPALGFVPCAFKDAVNSGGAGADDAPVMQLTTAELNDNIKNGRPGALCLELIQRRIRWLSVLFCLFLGLCIAQSDLF